MTPVEALTEAKKIVGGAGILAFQMGITPAALSQWRVVPVRRVLLVERLTGIPRHVLRPDFYPPSLHVAELPHGMTAE
jgi:DNA-binding transcriptional regulator YdaS (Cro superfamily)